MVAGQRVRVIPSPWGLRSNRAGQYGMIEEIRVLPTLKRDLPDITWVLVRFDDQALWWQNWELKVVSDDR